MPHAILMDRMRFIIIYLYRSSTSGRDGLNTHRCCACIAVLPCTHARTAPAAHHTCRPHHTRTPHHLLHHTSLHTSFYAPRTLTTHPPLHHTPTTCNTPTPHSPPLTPPPSIPTPPRPTPPSTTLLAHFHAAAHCTAHARTRLVAWTR